jgi:hypothetical protein
MLPNDALGQHATPNAGVLSRHPLVSYFIIAYAGSWLVVLPYLRSASGAGLLSFNWPVPFAVSAAIAPFAGPFLAAFLMTGVTEGKPNTPLATPDREVARGAHVVPCSPSSAFL